MSESSTRRRFLTTTAVGAAAAVSGCASGSPGASTDSAATEANENSADDETESSQSTENEKTLRLASGGKITSMDPVIKGTGLVNQWAETLMGYENGKLPPVPELAEDYEVSDDGTTYRFKLREGVKFHNGEELTATDFVYSWERLAQSPKTQNNDDLLGGTFTVAHERDKSKNDSEKSEISDYVPGSLGVSAPEKYVFQVELASPFHSSLAQIASESSFVVYPENTVGDIERDDVETDGKYSYQEAFGTDDDGPKVVGTGPFQIETWSKGNRLVVTKFEEYWGQTAKVDAVENTILGSEEAVYQRALNGNVDLFRIPGAKFDPERRSEMEDIGSGRRVGTYEMKNGHAVNTAEKGDIGVETVLFNTERVPKPVRQAFALMLNPKDIANNIYPDQEPAYSKVPPSIYPKSLDDYDSHEAAYTDHVENGAMSQTPWGADGYPWGMEEARMAEARKKIKDAGLEGETYTFHSAKRPASIALAQRIQQKFQAIGINCKINKASYGTRISKGIFEKQLDFYDLGDSAEWPESDNLLRFYHPAVSYQQASQWGTKTGEGEWATKYQQRNYDDWQKHYVPHRGPGEKNQRHRDRAYLTTIETNWQVVQVFPLAIRVNREYWLDDLDYEPPGIMGDKNYNTVDIDRS